MSRLVRTVHSHARMQTATATDRVLTGARVHSAQELPRGGRPVVEVPDDEVSVDVDLLELEATADSDNVFLQPTPPELCPWGVVDKPAALPPVNVIQRRHGEEMCNENLPRFSLLGPDSSRYGTEIASSSLPRFADGF